MTALRMVDFPDPEGPQMTNGFGSASWSTLADVLAEASLTSLTLPLDGVSVVAVESTIFTLLELVGQKSRKFFFFNLG